MSHARYTAVLKDIMEDPAAKAAIDKALSTYPLYQKKSKEEFIPAYIPTRQQLNEKILRHYKYREIGFETVGRFIDELEIAMQEIMPEYNLLFMTADQDFNIIFNVDYQRTIDRTQDASSTAETEATDKGNTQTTSTAQDTTTTSNEVESFNKGVKSGTPQGILNISSKNIDSVEYADEANWGNDNSSSSGTSSGSSSSGASSDHDNATTSSATGTNKETEKTLETTRGNFGVVSSQDLILKYRETIRNIEMEIINDPAIRNLFMLVY